MKRRLLSVLCLLCTLMNLLAFSVCAETSGDCGDNATWSLSDDGVLTISGSGAIRDYIYEGAEAWPLIKAPWRASAYKVKKVVVNSGITRIGDNAFCCLPNVTSVSIANTVTSIGQAAFCDMKALTQIALPESVVDVEKSLFHGCKSLTTVKLPSGLKTLTGIMFEDCSALKSIELPKGITEIQGRTFRFSGLTSITIPEGVTSIQSAAFQYCGNLTTVKLPSSLKEIENSAFDDTGITSIVFPANIQTIGRAFFWCHDLKSIYFEGDAPQIDAYAFEDVTATAYYPKDNPTWTEAVRQNYCGTITWVAYCGNKHTFNGGVVCTVCNATFGDVSLTGWQIAPVVYVCDKGLMLGKGTDENGKIKFDPNSPITREEFVQVLYNAEGKPSVDIANRFPDVSENGWYRNAVLWANSKNIANGGGDGKFGVGAKIIRQDLALMLYKYAALKGCRLEANEGITDQYGDSGKIADYAKTAMDWAVTNGILSGKGTAGQSLSSFRLDPTGTATRAECAAMLRNFMTEFEL